MSPRPLLTAAVAAAAVAGAPAVATAAPASHAVHVRVDAHGIHGPRTVPPGITTFSATVHTKATSSLAVARLRPGVTYRAIQRAAASGDLSEVFRRVTTQGGLAHLGPTTGHSWTTRLRRGRYIFVDDEAGMFAPFSVRGARTGAAAPRTDAAIRFTAGGIELPDGVGDGRWKVTNADTIARELGVIRIEGGHTPDEAIAAATSGTRPGWLTPVGTLNAVSPGQSAWYRLRHLHGDYLLIDYLPALQGAASGPLIVFHHFA
jgi:hypothetical protein